MLSSLLWLSKVYWSPASEGDCQSVWAPACQDQISGGHAGVGVVSLCGARFLTAPSPVAPDFRDFFRLGRAMRVTLPTGEGRSGSSFCGPWVSGFGGGC